jgi:peptidoglycan L-alanyl-D-glutamate endopeptidase CwlK
MRKYSQRSLSSLNGIHPDLRRVIDRALQSSPLDFAVIEGLRTKARQEQLVASGASTTMNSRHLTGHAVDLLPIDPTTGKGEFAWPLYDKLGPAVKAAAKKEGVPLIWGGDWTSFKDGPHFELDRRVYDEAKWTTTERPAEGRSSATESNTVRASAVTVASGAGSAVAALSALDSVAQYIVLAFAGVIVLAGIWIMRERLRKWADGDR